MKKNVELVLTSSKGVCRIPFESVADAALAMASAYGTMCYKHTEGAEKYKAHVLRKQSDYEANQADVFLSNGEHYHWEVRECNG